MQVVPPPLLPVTSLERQSSVRTPIWSRPAIKVEDDPIDEEEEGDTHISPVLHKTKPTYIDHSDLEEVSIALISPGLSRHTMNDHVMRENIRLSMSVKDRQRDLIQRRLNEQGPGPVSPSEQVSRHKRAPSRLTLSQPRYRTISSAQTAPLHGSFGRPLASPYARRPQHDPRHEVYVRPPREHHPHYATGPPPPPPHHNNTYLPPLTQHWRRPSVQQSARLTPPESRNCMVLPPLVRPFPPSPPRSSHDSATATATANVTAPAPSPPSGASTSAPESASESTTKSGPASVSTVSPMSSPDARPDEGLNTLSRAAKLKTLKEEYLKACSDSFDAFHGISFA